MECTKEGTSVMPTVEGQVQPSRAATAALACRPLLPCPLRLPLLLLEAEALPHSRVHVQTAAVDNDLGRRLATVVVATTGTTPEGGGETAARKRRRGRTARSKRASVGRDDGDDR